MDKDEKQAAAVPAPKKIVQYEICGDDSGNKGVLFLYGNSNNSKIALCCAGYADDHTVFQPFAKALSSGGGCGKGNNGGGNNEDVGDGGVFVGVMCLPGYDDRPQDDVPWTSHKADGYTIEEWANTIREAARVLRSESTNASAAFTGIFHDWAVLPGTLFVNRAIQEDGAPVYRPDNVVYFDILLKPSPDATDIPTKSEVIGPTAKEAVCSILYRLVLAESFLLQRYFSKIVGATFFVVGFSILEMLQLGPLKPFDAKSTEPLYKHNPRSLFRLVYMAYPYWNIFFKPMFSFGRGSLSLPLHLPTLHDDWNKTPILYMYGLEKRTMFHDPASVKMLEKEPQKESGSVSRAIAIKDAGHYLYVPLQKMELCVNAVLSFMNDDATAKEARASS